MARIHLTCPGSWNGILHSFSARQYVATVLSVILVIFLFLFIHSYYGQPLSQRTRDNALATTHLLADPKPRIGSNVQYAIVIDCGSSGSRVYIYFWPPHSGNPKDLLNIQQLLDKDNKPVVKKIMPGLDTLEAHPFNASEYIKPLLRYAAQHIPISRHRETLLFILATAGMRMIPSMAQKAIIDDLNNDIPKDFPFVMSENNIEVITGKMEGVYAWIAVNYALRRFDHGEQDASLVAVELPGETKTHVRRRTVGMIDMGGGSMQIAFEVTSKNTFLPPHRMAEFNLGCQNNDFDHTYRVYVTTFLGFGANEARYRYEQMLINKEHQMPEESASEPTSLPEKHSSHKHSDSSSHNKKYIYDDCLPHGMKFRSTDDLQHTHNFKGKGNYSGCSEKLFALLNKTMKCEFDPCSMNGVYQPNLHLDNTEFYGFSEFWYTMNDVYRKGGAYNFESFKKEAEKYCNTKWSQLMKWYEDKYYPKADKERMELQCFKSAWLTTVLHRGLGFPESYDKFRSVQLINGRDVQWTMGALIHRTRYLPLRTIESMSTSSYARSWSSKNSWYDYSGYMIIVCFIVVVVAILLYMKSLKILPRASDLKKVPSISLFKKEPNEVSDSEMGLLYQVA